MKVAKSLLLALAAFGAVTMTVAQPPGPVTPPACQMACHKGEYAKIQACNQDADCIAAVKASIASCMAACPPNGVSLVGDAACSAACLVQRAGCSAVCTPGDVICEAKCGAEFQTCTQSCATNNTPGEIPDWPLPNDKPTPAVVGDALCSTACVTEVAACTLACVGDMICQAKCGAQFMTCATECAKDNTPGVVPVWPVPTAPSNEKPTTVGDFPCSAKCIASYTGCVAMCPPGDAGCYAQCSIQQTACNAQCGPVKQKSQVGFYACEGCTGSYSQCADSCSAGDASCLNSCVNYFMGCMGQCDLSAVQATPVSMSCSSCKPAAAQCKSTCATIECDANCNFEYGKCANHCSNEVSLGATPVGDMKKQTMCKMACIGVEAAANTACKKWLPDSKVCLDNVAAARQMCDLGCELFKVSALPPVASSSCEAGCNSEYNQCVKSGSSPTTCFRAQKKCFDICHMSLASAESATMPALAMVAAAKHELKGVPCVSACAISKATASLLCYAYPDNLKQLCFDHLSTALSVCEFLCSFSPVMAVEAPKTEKAVVGSDCTSACWAADSACDAKCKTTCKGSFNVCYADCSNQCWWAGSDCTKKCDSSYTPSDAPSTPTTPTTPTSPDAPSTPPDVPPTPSTLAVAATPVSMSCFSCKPALAECKSTCASIECDANCNFEYGKCANHCSNEVSLGATPVGDMKKQTMCKMACIGVEAAANSACKNWLPKSQMCLDNVAAARQMCDLGCGLLKAPAVAPVLKGTACEASCNADFRHCTGSISMCARQQNDCFKLCHQNIASPMRRVAKAVQTRVGDVECAQCATSLKSCFMGCDLDSQCIGRCFSADWQCQLSC